MNDEMPKIGEINTEIFFDNDYGRCRYGEIIIRRTAKFTGREKITTQISIDTRLLISVIDDDKFIANLFRAHKDEIEELIKGV